MEKKESNFATRYLASDYERHDFGSQPKPLALDMKSGDQVLAYKEVILPMRSITACQSHAKLKLPYGSL